MGVSFITMLPIKYEKLTTKEKMILYFLLYAFIGWCLETIYAYMVFGHFVKRGFLFGPICPIYGFGAVLLITNLKNVKGNIFVKFLVAMVVFTVFEFAASFLLEALFNKRWWDYTNEFMNFQGRICLGFSILWGLLGVLFVDYVHPFIENKLTIALRFTPVSMQRIIIYSLGLTFIVDGVISICRFI